MNEKFISVRTHCEDLWVDFQEYADDNFLTEFQLHFHQRWFEMYLTVSLKQAGLDIVDGYRNSGPDLLALADGKRLWIEAVCAGKGDQGTPDCVPGIKPNVARDIPLRQYILRLRSSLEAKNNKLQQYIQNGIILPDDLTVIAINGGEIPFFPVYMDECIQMSVYGLDVFSVFVLANGPTGKVASIQRGSCASIAKSSGASVDVQCFIDGSMSHISVLLGSGVNAWNLPGELGEDFILYPNLASTQQWPYGIVPIDREWMFCESGEGWDGKLMEPPSPEHPSLLD